MSKPNINNQAWKLCLNDSIIYLLIHKGEAYTQKSDCSSLDIFNEDMLKWNINNKYEDENDKLELNNNNNILVLDFNNDKNGCIVEIYKSSDNAEEKDVYKRGCGIIISIDKFFKTACIENIDKKINKNNIYFNGVWKNLNYKLWMAISKDNIYIKEPNAIDYKRNEYIIEDNKLICKNELEIIIIDESKILVLIYGNSSILSNISRENDKIDIFMYTTLRKSGLQIICKKDY